MMGGPDAFAPHDHSFCRASAMARAEKLCAAQGLRLTDLRRRVLGVLLNDHRAMGAYDILDVLAAEGMRAQPPTVYRALEFLTDAGLAHRVHMLNAFVACDQAGDDHQPAFLVCKDCHGVSETSVEGGADALGIGRSDAVGFRAAMAVVEIPGQCPTCRAEGGGE